VDITGSGTSAEDQTKASMRECSMPPSRVIYPSIALTVARTSIGAVRNRDPDVQRAERQQEDEGAPLSIVVGYSNSHSE
jgi:hypothetical protein